MKNLEILIAAVTAFAIGMLWYTLLFGKQWQKESGVSDEQAKKGMGLTHGLAFLLMIVIAYFMNNGCLEDHINQGDFGHGLFHGGLYGVSYALPIIGINYLYQKKSFKLFLIDAGYALVFFSAIGGMLALLDLTGVK